MNYHVKSYQPKLVLLLIAVLSFSLQCALLARGMETVVSSMTIDDTYYYLQTAWNLKLFGYPTFDGIHSTNGVHLLWFWLLSLLGTFASTKEVFIYTALCLVFALNSSVYLVIWKIGGRLGNSFFTFLLAAYWTLEIFSGKYWTGMENSLHALIFWCVIWQALEFLIKVGKAEEPNRFLLMTFLVLNVWTRLDSAVFSVVIYALCELSLMFSIRNDENLLRSQRKKMAISLGTASAALLPIPLIYWAMGHSFLPVSALVKASSDNQAAGSSAGFIDMFRLSFPSVLPSPLRTHFGREIVGMASLLILFACGGVRGEGLDDRMHSMRKALLIVFAAFVAYHLAVVFLDVPYYSYYRWYRSPLYIFWVAAIAFAINFIVQEAALVGACIFNLLFKRRSTPPWSAGLFYRILIGAFVLNLFIYGYSGILKKLKRGPVSNERVLFYEAAVWISDNLPSDAVLASWNAGVLGYFSKQSLVNLDGLINDKYYFDKVISGDVELQTYLKLTSVDYIVDYCELRTPVPSDVIRAFTKDNCKYAVKIWKLR